MRFCVKKYKLTNERHESYGTLRRVRALRYIPRYGVRPGDLGGWIESENNLSQDGNCWVGEDAMVSGNAWVGEDAQVSGDAWIYGNAMVYGNAQVSGDARAWGDAHISQNGFVSSARDLLVVGPIGSRKACTTFYRAIGGIWVCCGCFNGSIEAFETAVKEKHGDGQNARVYLKAIELAKAQITAI